MRMLAAIDPVDYLVVGHLTQDLTSEGAKLGGTASYASLTAKALGLRVGIVTSCRDDLALPELEGIQVVRRSAEFNTTFENIQHPEGRVQILHHVAEQLDLSTIPESWRDAPLVHLGPVAREVDPNLARAFPKSFVGLTPQGWLRTWKGDGVVSLGDWPEETYVLENASAAVLSLEDVHGSEKRIEEMLGTVQVLVITEGAFGARVYWNGDVRRFAPPKVEEIDPVGAGDVFATAFFFRLHGTRDPWEATRFANQLAAISVTRRGLAGVPTNAEVYDALVEIINQA